MTEVGGFSDMKMARKSIISVPEYFSKDLGDKVIYVCGVQDRRETNAYHEDNYPMDAETAKMLQDLKCIARLSILGTDAYVYTPVIPDRLLLAHWSEKLYEGCLPRFKRLDLGAALPHVVPFPISYLDRNLHWVDPDLLYELHSKRFISTIDCPQAAVLDSNASTYPCVLKMCRATGGRGTFIICTHDEYNTRLAWIQKNEPRAETVLTEYVGAVQSYGYHLYLDKSGLATPLGVDIPESIETTGFIGATCYYENQKFLTKLLVPSAAPVVKALHERGYFGFVSMDILIDEFGKQYVVDINPRTSTIQMMFHAFPLMSQAGYNVCVLRRGRIEHCTIAELFNRIRKVCVRSDTTVDGPNSPGSTQNCSNGSTDDDSPAVGFASQEERGSDSESRVEGDMIVFSVIRAPDNCLLCIACAYARSRPECLKIFELCDITLHTFSQQP